MGFLDRVLGRSIGAGAVPLPAEWRTGARDFVDRIAPSDLDGAAPDRLVMHQDGAYIRSWWIEDLPLQMAFEAMDPLLHFPARITHSMVVEPLSVEEARQALKSQRVATQAGVLTRLQQRRLVDYDQVEEVRSIERELERLQLAGQVPLRLYWVITVFASSEEELEDLTGKIEDLLLASDLTFHRAVWRQEQAFRSLVPLGVNFLGEWRNVNADTLAVLYPFSRRSHYQPHGIPYGIDRDSGAWVILDDWSLPTNSNALILGEMGSGKSMFLKWKALWHYLLGERVFIIDLEDEFRPLADLVGVEYVDLGLTSEVTLNVISLNPDDPEGYYSAVQDLVGWVRMAAGGLTAAEENALFRAYARMMQKVGVVEDDRSTWTKPPGELPTLQDIYSALIVDDRPAARDVAERLEQFAVGMYARAFSARTTLDPRGRLVIFGMARVQDERLKSLRMRQVISYIWGRMTGPIVPTVVMVDEAWHWLRHPHAAGDLEAIGRRFRKRQGALQLATQHFLELQATGSAQVIRDTAGITVLFRHRRAAAGAVAQLFGLNEAEASNLQVLAPGEALIIVGDDRIPVYVAVPPDLLALFSTRPQDRQAEEG